MNEQVLAISQLPFNDTSSKSAEVESLAIHLQCFKGVTFLFDVWQRFRCIPFLWIPIFCFSVKVLFEKPPDYWHKHFGSERWQLSIINNICIFWHHESQSFFAFAQNTICLINNAAGTIKLCFIIAVDGSNKLKTHTQWDKSRALCNVLILIQSMLFS